MIPESAAQTRAPLHLILILGDDRDRAAAALAETWLAAHPGAARLDAPPAATWPFVHPLAAGLPDGPLLVVARDVHEAAVNHQTAGTRLVTTQLTYLFEEWHAALGGRTEPATLIATADEATLQAHAPEALTGRGPFRAAAIERTASASAREDLDASYGETSPKRPDGREGGPKRPDGREGGPKRPDGREDGPLLAAFRSADPARRLALCVEALAHGRTAPALVATASACMEVNDLEAAGRDLDEAIALAPAWAAAWFERGKLWLRIDDMEQASHAFKQAAERLPAFASAWANLGATCGELDRTEEALAAFEHALTCDPENQQVLNNIGVVRRELGRLPESETAFRAVIARAPDLAFGYYNLGHTLFLQGRYHAALAAYADGQRRDAERNPVQAMRLALCRLATGDAPAALRDLQQTAAGLPREYRRQLLADANAIVWALVTHKPDLPGWKQVNDWLGGELHKLA